MSGSEQNPFPIGREIGTGCAAHASTDQFRLPAVERLRVDLVERVFRPYCLIDDSFAVGGEVPFARPGELPRGLGALASVPNWRIILANSRWTAAGEGTVPAGLGK